MATILPSRPRQTGSRRTFAIVASQYNPAFVAGLVDNTRRELDVLAPNSQIHVVEVPGAFEIPLIVQEIARNGGYDAIIALGVIIEGATAHASLIAGTITTSLQQLSLTYKVPIVHEVLLVKDEDQARARCLDPDLNRGVEAARVACRMAQVMTSLHRHH